MSVQHLDNADRISRVERFYRRIRAKVVHGHRQAAYEPDSDRILMPEFERFHQVGSYYSTLAHEHVHWTKSRVERDDKFGVVRKNIPTRQSYAYEELVAELGAAFVCYRLGIEKEPRPDHAAYLDSWLTMFREHDLILWDATREAQKAADYLLRKGGILKVPGRKPSPRVLGKGT